MLGLFGIIIYLGPLALMVTVSKPFVFYDYFSKILSTSTTYVSNLMISHPQTLVVQVKCFAEIINIGYSVYRVHNLPWFRSLSWYFLIASNYFFYGESMVDYFGVFVNRTASLNLTFFVTNNMSPMTLD